MRLFPNPTNNYLAKRKLITTIDVLKKQWKSVPARERSGVSDQDCYGVYPWDSIDQYEKEDDENH